jgi:hypothetical protein
VMCAEDMTLLTQRQKTLLLMAEDMV